MRWEWVPDISRFEPEWRALHRASPSAHPFHSPEWVTAWYATVGRLFWPRILAGYEGRDLVAAWPFAATLRTWYVAGTGVSDYLDPLARAPLSAEAIQGALEQVMALRPALLDLHQLPESTPTPTEGQRFVQAVTSRIQLPTTFDDYAARLSASLRQDIRNSQKKASLQLEWVDAETFFPIFFDLHRKRWQRRRLPGAFALPGRQRFHEAFGASVTGNRMQRFGVLSQEGQPIGALYGMTSGNRAFFYQSGFDPEASKLGPGTALIAGFIQRSIDEGLEQFDFLRGEERYKLRWRPDDIGHNVRYVWPPESKIAGRAVKIHHRLDAWIRKHLEKG